MYDKRNSIHLRINKFIAKETLKLVGSLVLILLTGLYTVSVL